MRLIAILFVTVILSIGFSSNAKGQDYYHRVYTHDSASNHFKNYDHKYACCGHSWGWGWGWGRHHGCCSAHEGCKHESHECKHECRHETCSRHSDCHDHCWYHRYYYRGGGY